MKIINLTQHTATDDQREAGVIDLPGLQRRQLQELLTFDTLPTMTQIDRRAAQIAHLAADSGCSHAMVGGAPYLMTSLEMALQKEMIRVLYAFSKRESVEVTDADGSVRKTNVFRHIGFVEV